MPLLAIVPAAVALQYALVLQPAQEAFDQALGNTAISVGGYLRLDDGRVQFDMNPQVERSIRTDQQDSIYYAVLAPDGSRAAGDPPLQQPALQLAADTWRYFDGEIDGQAVRIVARGVACGEAVCQVRVAETLVKRQRVFRQSLLGALGGVLAFAAASVAAILVAARRGLRPLRLLSRQMGQRSLDDLRPLPMQQAPRELHGLVTAMNQLLERVRTGSLAQQAFLADAAHQLRTPLAALKTEAELALAAPHPPEMQATLQRLNAGAERAARLSSQLLALARADSAAAASLPAEALDWKTIAEDAVQDWVPRALAAQVDLGFELHSAPLQGRRFLLRELLANLLHNALAYAGPGARVTVRSAVQAGQAVLEVEDDGPGIAPEEREAVFQRFARGAAATQAALQGGGAAAEGSGLGLAIVRDIAQGHGGTVQIHTPPGGRGTLVRVALPQAGGPGGPA